ncbi:hypothetical protein I4S20_003237 [Salmonella enterica]|nr:hypothetical protein [Salmonella enterica]EGP4069401.1 hypothetical protein [Salmonella enterica]EGS7251606.1 hypothetical protein [Salmonella enterica]
MNTQALFCLSLPLVIAGCAQQTSTSTARDSAFAQSLRPPVFSDIYQRSPEVTRSGRYTLVSVKSADAQREPLNQLIDITMPGQLVNSVGDGFRYRSFLKKNHPTELERYDEACEALRREEFARFAELQTLGLYLHLQVQQKEAQFRRRRNRLLLGMTITGVMTSVLLYANFYPEQLQLISHELATLPGRISGFVGRLLH